MNLRKCETCGNPSGLKRINETLTVCEFCGSEYESKVKNSISYSFPLGISTAMGITSFDKKKYRLPQIINQRHIFSESGEIMTTEYD